MLLVLVQVEGGVKPLAHDESLSHLEVDLVSVQGLKEDEGDESAERNAVHPDGQKAGAAGVYEVALSDVEQIGSCETWGAEKIGFPKTLGVVESVNDSLIQLPRVLIHS